MRPLNLAILLRPSYRYKLVADAVGSQCLFEGVGLLHMGEEDVVELCAMVGLDLLEGKGSHKPHLSGLTTKYIRTNSVEWPYEHIVICHSEPEAKNLGWLGLHDRKQRRSRPLPRFFLVLPRKDSSE